MKELQLEYEASRINQSGSWKWYYAWGWLSGDLLGSATFWMIALAILHEHAILAWVSVCSFFLLSATVTIWIAGRSRRHADHKARQAWLYGILTGFWMTTWLSGSMMLLHHLNL